MTAKMPVGADDPLYNAAPPPPRVRRQFGEEGGGGGSGSDGSGDDSDDSVEAYSDGGAGDTRCNYPLT